MNLITYYFMILRILSLVGLFLMVGCNNNDRSSRFSKSYCDFVALTIFDYLYIYKSSMSDGESDSSVVFKVESAIQDHLLRALYIVQQINSGDPRRTQLDFALERSRNVFHEYPIRCIFKRGEIRRFDESEPILPAHIDAGTIFFNYFGDVSVRELRVD
jgi:hypothetical protein